VWGMASMTEEDEDGCTVVMEGRAISCMERVTRGMITT
jgi:hypothetical protein